MELYVVRHGQTEYNRKNLFQGHTDIPLNNVGIEQSKKLASKFRNIELDIILTSPLKRAIQTAEYISNVINLKYYICLIFPYNLIFAYY